MDKFDQEKRNDCRINIEMDLIMYKIIYNDKILELPKPIPIKIKNLSCGGILIYSKIDFPENTCFYLKFQTKNNIMELIVEIIRKEYNRKSFIYGCRFLQLSPIEQQQLRQFIFEQEVKLRKKL